jgi:filamentous hemagglutinin family protein
MNMPYIQRSLLSLTLSVASSISLCLLLPHNPTDAQITPDATLGTERSVVTPNVNINGTSSDRIDGGAIRGANLFHSFVEFNVGNQGAIYFSNPAGINNILSRVTGINPSQIQGTLGVLGNANLFLINPNGIIFGPSARLDMGGSFVASTANSIVFGNGYQFSATNPSAPPLLTINVPVGLQYGTQQPAALVNAGNLAVQPEQNITLVGGTVVATGQLQASSGQANVVAVPGESRVQLGQGGRVLSVSSATNSQSTTPTASNLAELLNNVNYDTGLAVTPDGQVELKGSGTRVSADVGTAIVSGTLDASNSAVGQTGGTVQVLGHRVGLFDKAAINVSGQAGGGTALIGGNYQGQGLLPNALATYVDRNVKINADATGTGNGGLIVLWSEDSTRAYGTLSARGGAVAGHGGLIETSSRNFLDVAGIKVNATAANGISGTWLIDPRNIIIQNAATANGTFSGGNPNVFTPGDDDAVISIQDIEAQLNAGTNVTITTGSTGTQEGNITVIDPITKTAGGAATLILEAANNITFNSGAKITSESDALNMILTADSDRSGIGDLILIGTGEEDLYEIEANGGNVSVTANSILLDNAGNIHSDGNGTRNGGSITINVRSMSLSNSSGIGSDTKGEGNAGPVTVNADIATFVENSGLSSNTFGSGHAGQVALNAGSVFIKNAGLAAVSDNEASGNSGQILINANTLTMENSGLGTYSATSGNAGVIDVKAGSLVLKSSAFDNNAYSDGNGGQIKIEAGSLSLTEGSALANNALGQGKGGQVTITGDSVAMTDGGGISAKTLNSREAGQVTITANSVVFADAGGIDTNPTDFDDNPGNGNGGNVTINAGSLLMKNTGFGLSTKGSGNAGNFTITADAIALEDSGIGTATAGSGNAGQINVTAGSLSLKNSAFDSATYGEGNAGQINITANSISLTDISGISTETQGSGKGGQISVRTNSLSISGDGGMSTKTQGSGDAGQIDITAGTILLQSGGLSSQTSGTGNGGQVNVTADFVLLEGERFSISTDSTRSGNGGNVNLNVGTLIVRDGAEAAVNSSGSGDAGTLTIVGDSIRLDTGGKLNASSVSGQGGNINLKAKDIQMRRGSSITTNASSANGGNITIDTGVLIALENSDISANSTDARGGNIKISAQGIFGTSFRPALTSDNDITASGKDNSLSGTVEINRLGVDPSQGLNALPETVIDPAALIAQNPCTQVKTSTFLVTGRGGFPDNPSEPLNSDAVWTDLRGSTSSTENRTSSQQVSPPNHSTGTPLLEAQTWAFNDKGEVVLLAHSSANTFSPYPRSNSSGCRIP